MYYLTGSYRLSFESSWLEVSSRFDCFSWKLCHRYVRIEVTSCITHWPPLIFSWTFVETSSSVHFYGLKFLPKSSPDTWHCTDWRCIDVSERCVAKLAVFAALPNSDAHASGLCQAESRSRPPLWKLSGLIRAFSLTSLGPSLCTQAWILRAAEVVTALPAVASLLTKVGVKHIRLIAALLRATVP